MRAALIALAVVAAGIAVATAVVVGTTQPLRGATYAWGDPGYPARLAWEVRNDGSLPVRVNAIDAPLPGVSVRLGTNPHTLANRPFRAFDLAAGDAQPIVLVSTLPHCARDGGGWVETGAQRVHFTVLGVPRTEWVEFGEASGAGLAWRKTGDGTCLVTPPVP